MENIMVAAANEVSVVNYNKLIKDLHLVAEESKIVVEAGERTIIYLEKNVMDENEIDAANEALRKEMRPLVNEVMNCIKIDRNLTQMMLDEIRVAQSVMKAGGSMFTPRFVSRYNSVRAEIMTTGEQARVSLATLAQKYPHLFVVGNVNFSEVFGKV
jgi:hypothetical protein